MIESKLSRRKNMAKPCFLTWFSHGFSAWQFLSVSGLLIAATTWYFGFFQLSVTRFACDIGQSAKIWICVSSEVIIICSAFSGLFANQPITSLPATPCWRDPARSKQLFTVAILGFQFGLYHVVVPLALHVVSALHHCSLTLNLAYCIFCGCFFFVYFFSQVHWVSLSLHTPSCICRHPKNSDRFLIHLRWFLSRRFREY